MKLIVEFRVNVRLYTYNINQRESRMSHVTFDILPNITYLLNGKTYIRDFIRKRGSF